LGLSARLAARGKQAPHRCEISGWRERKIGADAGFAFTARVRSMANIVSRLSDLESLTDKVASEIRCLNASLRAQRSNPCLRAGAEWIASSQGLLAMTHSNTSRHRQRMRSAEFQPIDFTGIDHLATVAA
jgi:hypothetical protein